uniref:Receptor expression-enhancing protein n=1 Tax=Romanomermis culicivorax TaxID=13658 RepID=A0A915KZY0_ROMCU
MAEYIENFKVELSAYLRSNKGLIPNLTAIVEKLIGVEREIIFSIVGSLLVIILVLPDFAGLVCTLIAFAYPAYASNILSLSLYVDLVIKYPDSTVDFHFCRSVNAIETEDKSDDTHWLVYWTVFAVFSIVDFGAERICAYFPFYWLAKCIFLVYLYEPHFYGASRLYVSSVRPSIRYVHRWLTATFGHGGVDGQAAAATQAQPPVVPGQQEEAPPAQQAPPSQQAPPPPAP